ncbi:hypothetical protein EK904_006926 [Melospiza melodia maxima]|nr:hypothetical protein EK904_006926 [Melospiza melodia maxima]
MASSSGVVTLDLESSTSFLDRQSAQSSFLPSDLTERRMTGEEESAGRRVCEILFWNPTLKTELDILHFCPYSYTGLLQHLQIFVTLNLIKSEGVKVLPCRP